MTREQLEPMACNTTDCPIAALCGRQNPLQYPNHITFSFDYTQNTRPTDELSATCDYFEQLEP
jgi:hypothetical protein